MNLYKITLLSSSLFLFACSNETAQENINATPTTETVETPTVQSATPVQENVNADMPAVYTQDNSEVQINPPHGQPGHDCAVPVGAPLPTAGSATQQPVAPSFLQPTTAPEGVTVNPPHGQPGHDCAVPVGAPLYN